MTNPPDQHQNARSTLITAELLRLICRNPNHFAKNETILKALNSQGALAKLEFSFEVSGARKLKLPMSINTLKSQADTQLTGGFKELDTLRQAAKTATHKATNSEEIQKSKRTKSGLSKLTNELEEQLYKQRRTNMILLQGLNLAIHELRNIRSNLDPALLEKRASDAAQALTALLRLPSEQPLQPTPLSGDGRVTRLEEYRK